MAWSGTGTIETTTPAVAGTYTLAQAMLDIARLLGGLRSGVATGGSTSTLVDTLRNEEAEFWKGGTIWITSGVNSGVCLPIISFLGNTITFATLASTISSGDEYHVLPPEFPMDTIRHAVQSALNDLGDIINYDDSLETDSEDEEYELPAGVYNVRRVEIASSETAPYNYSPSYSWRELNGYLHFIPSKKPGTDGFKIRVWYVAPHAEVFLYSDTIAHSVDRAWLAWAGVAGVLRNSISTKGKDKAINIDLLNQAMMKEQEMRNRNKRKHMMLQSPDPVLNP